MTHIEHTFDTPESWTFATSTNSSREQRHRSVQEGEVENMTTTTSTQRTRRFNLLSILPLTTNPSTDVNGRRVPILFRIEIEMSAWLAWYHYTNPSSNTNNVLPHIRERLSTCDIDFHLSMRDSKFSPLKSAKEFLNAYYASAAVSFVNNTNTYPEGSLLHDLQTILNHSSSEQRKGLTRPDAVIGSARSTESSAISYLTSAFQVPQISSTSAASYLDEKDAYGTFARTIATKEGEATAMAIYLNYLQVTHVGILYINDLYGNDIHSHLVKKLQSFNISVFSNSYDDLSIEKSVELLATSQLKYFIAILNPSNWQSVIRLADQYQIIGRPDYFWMFEMLQFNVASFKLDRETETDLALAISGSAVIAATEQAFEPFDLALSNATEDGNLLSLYIQQHDEPDIFNNYSFVSPSRTIYQYFTYDAVTAMMLAACETPIADDQESSRIYGSRIYDQLVRTEFEGVSGYVAFDPTTGTRKSESLVFGVRNIQFTDNLMTGTVIKVSSTLTNIVTLASTLSMASSSEHIKVVEQFKYAGNTTIPPLPLPPVEVDLNLIPTPVLVLCLSLCGIAMIMSLWWIDWTYRNRQKDVVKSSQPIFLCQICIGTFLIASAVIPMSLQEPIGRRGLDISCMAPIWLYSVGFVTAFSALFTKTWRLNRVYRSSKKFRRVAIRPHDVALPFVTMMTLNIVLLLAWTLHSPLVFDHRIIDNFDRFGRSVESVGVCVSSDARHTYIYLSLLGVVNISVIIFANYQAYIARTLPTEYSESTYIAIAMGSLLEVIVLGIPLLFVASSDNTIRFVIRSVLTIATSLCPLLPIFVPKYVQRNVNRRYHDAVVADTGSAPTLTKLFVNTGSSSFQYSDLQPSDFLEKRIDDVHDSDHVRESLRGTSTIRRNSEFLKERYTATIRKSITVPTSR